MSTSTSSLLKTKNSSKLVKRFLQRTADWQTQLHDDEKAATSKSAKVAKKRKRDNALVNTSHTQQNKTVSEEEIVNRHIKTLLDMDATMNDPPTKAKKRRKKTNIQVVMNRLERQDRDVTKMRQKASNLMVGSSRSSAVQSQIVHEPTFNKKRYAKQKKEESLKKIAKMLKKQASKKQKMS